MLHLMILLPYTDACADIVAACAWEVVYTPESIGGVTAIALCVVSSINSKSWLKTQSAKQTATPSVSDMRT